MDTSQYNSLLEISNNAYTEGQATYIFNGASDFYDWAEGIYGTHIIKNANGEVLNITSEYDHVTNLPTNIGNVSNSNNLPSQFGNSASGVSTPQLTEFKTGQLYTERGITGGLEGIQFVTGSVIPAIAAVGTGIALGKAFDSALYNVAPDFWDAKGMQSLNPETWASITEGQDGISANLFNMIFGIDQTTQKTQAYLPDTAFAYLALYMQQKGVFSASQYIIPSIETTFDGKYRASNESDLAYRSFSIEKDVYNYYINGFKVNQLIFNLNAQYNYGHAIRIHSLNLNKDYYITNSYFLYFLNEDKNRLYSYRAFEFNANDISNDNINNWQLYGDSEYSISAGNGSNSIISVFNHNEKIKYIFLSSARYDGISVINTVLNANNIEISTLPIQNIVSDYTLIAYIFNGYYSSEISGITTQPNATTPSLNNDMSLAGVLSALKEQFSSLWQNAVTNNVVQPDGSTIMTTYIPIPWPEASTSTDTQPISGTSTQANPEIDPETATQPQIDILVTTTTNTGISEPPDTGNGDTPAIVIPVGTTQSLWSLYNPTVSQLNSFARWLWSDAFVDQLLKIFNDPMESIIGLHKIFLSPSNGENSNIMVGYLDTQVSSKTVNNQYASLSCGSLDLYEYFGNVFDYPPFTEVSLYLPFIGIVRLNPNDILRSTVTVTYHCDVLTGDILVEVHVKRDNAGGNIYTYKGNCAVKYPLSSGSYLGIISGAIIATGSLLADNPAGFAMGAASMHTSVSRSGNLSGNAGAMGARKPYFIISRPQTAMPNIFETIEGIPSNNTVRLGICQGFIRCKDFHLEGIPLTDGEKDILSNILKEGIVI